MKSFSKIFIGFLLGAAAGGCGGFLIARRAISEKDESEFKSVREYYEEKIKELEQAYKEENEARLNEAKEQTSKLNEIKNSTNIVDYAKSLGYSVDEDLTIPGKPLGISDIPFDMLGEDRSYGVETVTRYADGTLAYDSDDSIVANADILFGPNLLSRFVFEDPDTLYIKNDNVKKYFEISKSGKTYDEVAGVGYSAPIPAETDEDVIDFEEPDLDDEDEL